MLLQGSPRCQVADYAEDMSHSIKKDQEVLFAQEYHSEESHLLDALCKEQIEHIPSYAIWGILHPKSWCVSLPLAVPSHWSSV